MKQKSTDFLETNLNMTTGEISEFFGIKRSWMYKILHLGAVPTGKLEKEIQKLHLKLIDAIQAFYLAGGYPEPPEEAIASPTEIKEEAIITLQLQIKKLRRDLEDMKSNYEKSHHAYYHISNLLNSGNEFSGYQQDLLTDKQETCLHQLRKTHPIQQEILAAKIAGLERQVEILRDGML